MKRISGLMAALLAQASIFDTAIMRNFIKAPEPRVANRGVRNGRNKTGKTYPHSSKRQQARYARQIAAGQLSFT